MEIGSTLLNGLARVITGSEQTPTQTSSFTVPEALRDKLGQPANGILESGQAQMDQVGTNSSILSSNEKEIIDLFFGDREEINLALYGSQPSTPVALGNFIDVRG